jgi:Taurine catabolism dioxygenase TauD, TfdA family.
MIESIKILPDSLYVKFKNKIEDNFPNIWLRDNAKDEENWDYRSNQRKTYTASLSSKLFIKEASIIDNGKYIKILWSDSKKVIRYSTEFLSNNSLKKNIFNHKNILWKKKDISNQVFLNYNDILSKKGFKFFLKNLYDIGFCVIKNCKTQIETVESIANKIGYVRNSIFGSLWNFESNEDMADSAYTQDELRPHTDSTYSNDAPGLQLLLCCDYNATGGDSIMVDGFKIAEVIKNDDKEIFDILSNIEVPGK